MTSSSSISGGRLRAPSTSRSANRSASRPTRCWPWEPSVRSGGPAWGRAPRARRGGGRGGGGHVVAVRAVRGEAALDVAGAALVQLAAEPIGVGRLGAGLVAQL